MPEIKKSLGEFIGDAITQDYLITAAITSYTQAKNQTRNLPFGLGKTTLAMDLSYLLQGGSIHDNYQNNNVWEKVKENIVYNAYDLGVLLEPGTKRKTCVIWDDVQATAPASQSVPKPIRALANFISTERPEVALIIFTTPNLNFISAPLRKLVNFEIIVSERGLYEVHKLSYYKDFKRPLQDRMHFDYVEEVPRDEPFPPLPAHIKEWYNQWRIEHKKQLYPSMIRDLKVCNQLQTWDGLSEDIPPMEIEVIKAANGYVAKLPHELGERYHRKKLNAIFSPSM